MNYADSTREMIAEATIRALTEPTFSKPVESGGAARAAHMLAELL